MLKLGMGIDTLPLVAALARQPELWGAFNAAPDVMVLRGPRHDTGEIVAFPAMDFLWQARPLIFQLMARMEGEFLGVVEILKIPAGAIGQLKREAPHNLYAYVLSAPPGFLLNSTLSVGGDVWWLGPSAVYQNNSAEEVLVLSVGLVPASPCTYVPE